MSVDRVNTFATFILDEPEEQERKFPVVFGILVQPNMTLQDFERRAKSDQRDGLFLSPTRVVAISPKSKPTLKAVRAAQKAKDPEKAAATAMSNVAAIRRNEITSLTVTSKPPNGWRLVGGRFVHVEDGQGRMLVFFPMGTYEDLDEKLASYSERLGHSVPREAPDTVDEPVPPKPQPTSAHEPASAIDSPRTTAPTGRTERHTAAKPVSQSESRKTAIAVLIVALLVVVLVAMSRSGSERTSTSAVDDYDAANAAILERFESGACWINGWESSLPCPDAVPPGFENLLNGLYDVRDAANGPAISMYALTTVGGGDGPDSQNEAGLVASLDFAPLNNSMTVNDCPRRVEFEEPTSYVQTIRGDQDGVICWNTHAPNGQGALLVAWTEPGTGQPFAAELVLNLYPNWCAEAELFALAGRKVAESGLCHSRDRFTIDERIIAFDDDLVTTFINSVRMWS